MWNKYTSAAAMPSEPAEKVRQVCPFYFEWHEALHDNKDAAPAQFIKSDNLNSSQERSQMSHDQPPGTSQKATESSDGTLPSNTAERDNAANSASQSFTSFLSRVGELERKVFGKVNAEGSVLNQRLIKLEEQFQFTERGTTNERLLRLEKEVG